MKIKLFIFIVLITFPSLSFANANSEKLIQELSKWSFNKKETVKNSIKLIKSGADVNFQRKRNGDTPLILASSKGLYEVVKVLLKKGAKINESNNEGMNPIIATAYIGVTQGRLNKADKKKVKDREKVLKLLIKNKANLNYQVYVNSNFG